MDNGKEAEMYGCRAKIAFMLPSSCTVFEYDFLKITAGMEGVIGCPTRLLIEDTDAAGLAEMNSGIDLAARQLATIVPDVVVYMCTSGSFKDGQDGNDAIKDRLRNITGCRQVTTTSEAVVDAMRTLKMRSVAMLTPYDKDLTEREVDYLAFHDIGVVDFQFRDIEDNLDRGSVRPDETYRNAVELNYSEADGIFVSCANIRVLEIIDSLEARCGRPIVSSSQVTVWKALRMAGVAEPISGFGTLFRDH